MELIYPLSSNIKTYYKIILQFMHLCIIPFRFVMFRPCIEIIFYIEDWNLVSLTQNGLK